MRKDGRLMFGVVLSTMLCLVINDLNELLVWQTSYVKAIGHVQKSDKPLFIVIDKGSSSLGKMVTDGLFLSDQVEDALASDYYRMFIDTETEHGKKLAGQFQSDGLPRIVVID